MKIKICSVLAVTALLFILSGCTASKSKTIVSGDLGIDASGGKTLSRVETHSGFQGDGILAISILFDDDSVQKDIQDDSAWKPLPFDNTVVALLQDASDLLEKGFPSQDNTSGPEAVKNGYYLLIDRHSNQKTDILERYSYNYTLAVYDSDSNILYYFRLDT